MFSFIFSGSSVLYDSNIAPGFGQGNSIRCFNVNNFNFMTRLISRYRFFNHVDLDYFSFFELSSGGYGSTE
ncbi:hypothetical protein BCN13_28065 [Salmonella enterica]|nr:hypothetical protein [Salmonella enterica]EAQ6819801.1 hypothetical protein [Salmonella enterica]